VIERVRNNYYQKATEMGKEDYLIFYRNKYRILKDKEHPTFAGMQENSAGYENP
jgi:hypothetical protein